MRRRSYGLHDMVHCKWKICRRSNWIRSCNVVPLTLGLNVYLGRIALPKYKALDYNPSSQE